jgi:hypothetical protein
LIRPLASVVCLAALGVAVPAAASDVPEPTFIAKLRAAIHARIDAAIAASPPPVVPPRPVKLGWKLTKIGTLDLGAPLAALAAGDADGDGKAELYAVTRDELIAIAIVDGKPKVTGRIGFAHGPAPAPPRDVVASVVVDGATVRAAASPWLHGVNASWQGGVLVGAQAEPGFPQCPGETLRLTPGRNYFGDTYGVRCASGFVDAEGHPLRARATLSVANKLEITVERCVTFAGLGCKPQDTYEHGGIGTAFAVADLDRDGTLELVAAGAGAPGDPDALRVVALGATDKARPKLRKAFTAGGISGIAVGDVDGNGVADAIAAVRVIGAPRVDLWRLE